MPGTHASDDNTGPIVQFFRNESPDDSGRYLHEILSWPDEPLEYTHSYIQWLFPMRTPSPVNPEAPTVDDATVAAFAADPKLREAMVGAFRRMMSFYGMDVQIKEGIVTVARSTRWAKRSANWLTPRNHNMLRITRIITSLRLLGLEDYAQAFFEALSALYASDDGGAIEETTYGFWKSAAGLRE